MSIQRLNWASAGPAVTAAEANASRNAWIRDMEGMGQDTPAYLARLHLIRTQEARRIAAIEGQK